MAGRKWEHSISPKPQPHTTNPWREDKDKTVGGKNERADHDNRKALALQSNTIKHRVTKIVPKRHREGHKASAILRSPTTRRRERVPMSNQRTTSNMRFTYSKGNAPFKGCIALLLILNNMHNSLQIDDGQGFTLKHHPLKNQLSRQLCPVV